MAEDSLGQGTGLYLHLPLCPSRCPYCDFFAQRFSKKQARLLEAGLFSHLALPGRAKDAGRLTTLYIGGGTPSMWPAAFIARLLEEIDQRLGIGPGAEISLEANPGGLSLAKLKALARAGVNRLSLGAQSFDSAMLKSLGRRHTPEDTMRCLDQARRAGFENINLDIIYGLPGQNRETARQDLATAVALQSEHLSLYELTLGPGTEFARKYQKDRPPLPAEQEMAAIEDQALEMLFASGLERYEVSNFARPGFTCRHNQSTWQGGNYLALGPGAHGHMNGRRWSLVLDFAEYLGLAGRGREPLAMEERLSPEQRALELIMLGLRTTRGVDMAAVEGLLGAQAHERCEQPLERIQGLGWARLEGDFLRPTALGLTMADSAAALFIA